MANGHDNSEMTDSPVNHPHSSNQQLNHAHGRNQDLGLQPQNPFPQLGVASRYMPSTPSTLALPSSTHIASQQRSEPQRHPKPFQAIAPETPVTIPHGSSSHGQPPKCKTSKCEPHEWVIQPPTRQYHGSINDLTAFREAKNARPRHPKVVDENTPGFLADTKKHALVIYNAFYNTEDIIDRDKENGKHGTAVQWMENGYWDDDLIYMASWKIVFDWLDASAGTVMGGYVNIKRGSRTIRTPRVVVDQYENPADRFKMIHRTVWLSKNFCKNWLDTELGNVQLKLVAAPETMINRKDIEAKNNTRRRVNQRALKLAVKSQPSDSLKPPELRNRKRSMVSEEEEDAAFEVPSSPLLDMQNRALAKRQRGLDNQVKYDSPQSAVTNVSNLFSNQLLRSSHFPGAKITKSTRPNLSKENGLGSNPYGQSNFFSTPFQTPQRQFPIQNDARAWGDARTQHSEFGQDIQEQRSSSYDNPFNSQSMTGKASLGNSTIPNALGLIFGQDSADNSWPHISTGPAFGAGSQLTPQRPPQPFVNNWEEIPNARIPSRVPRSTNPFASGFLYQPSQLSVQYHQHIDDRTATHLRNPPARSRKGQGATLTEQPSRYPQDCTNTPQYSSNFPPIPADCLSPSPGQVYDHSSSSPPLTHDQMMKFLDNSFPDTLNADNEFGASGT